MEELYKKYRPKTFDEVFGSESTVGAIRNAVKEKKVPHAILFSGPVGTGKTTLARILKTKLGTHDCDYREINSASFRGIDMIRDIQSKYRLAPAGKGPRIYVIDEAHKLTDDAQNAALKMLEDTPKHCHFILLTSEPEKLIAGVRSRCSPMPLQLIPDDQLKSLCQRVAKAEKIKLSDKTFNSLVDASMGSARTALVGLELLGNIDEKFRETEMEKVAGRINESIDLCRALINNSGNSGWNQISAILQNMKGEPESIRMAVLNYAKSVLLKNPTLKAAKIMECFSGNFYNSKMAGLVLACWNCTR